jgi:hypothetical protein
MCDIRDERSLTVCDVAIARYRDKLIPRLGQAVSFTHVDYQPTLVVCRDPARLEEFATLVKELMDSAKDLD